MNHFKSQKTLNRIEFVESEIKSYRESIKLLNAYAEGRKTRITKQYTDQGFNYKRTAEDEERYRGTLQNINIQMQLYERELSALLEYGA